MYLKLVHCLVLQPHPKQNALCGRVRELGGGEMGVES